MIDGEEVTATLTVLAARNGDEVELNASVNPTDSGVLLANGL